MQNVWVISGGVSGRNATIEFYPTEAEAQARVAALEAAARRSFEEIDARADLGVTCEQYQEIQGLATYEMTEVPHVESVHSDNDDVSPTGEVPADQIWLVLEDGRPEEGRSYFTSEEAAKDEAWERNWARWEYYQADSEADSATFAEHRASRESGRYDYAPADPGPTSA